MIVEVINEIVLCYNVIDKIDTCRNYYHAINAIPAIDNLLKQTHPTYKY